MSDYRLFKLRLKLFCAANFAGVRFGYSYTHVNQPIIEIADESTGKLLFERHFHEQDGWGYGRECINDICTGGLSDERCAERIEDEMLQEIPQAYRRTLNGDGVKSAVDAYYRLSCEEQEQFCARLGLRPR